MKRRKRNKGPEPKFLEIMQGEGGGTYTISRTSISSFIDPKQETKNKFFFLSKSADCQQWHVTHNAMGAKCLWIISMIIIDRKI